MKAQQKPQNVWLDSVSYAMLVFIALFILKDLTFWLLVVATLTCAYYMLRHVVAAFRQAATLFFYSLMMFAFIATSVAAFPYIYRVYSMM